MARLIDHLLLAVVNGIIAGVLVAGILGLDAATFGGLGGASYAAVAVSSILSVAIALGYFGYMDSTQGRTLGKMVMKLRVVGASGDKPTFEESVKRNVWIALGLGGLIPFLNILTSLAQLVVVILIAVQINSDSEKKPWTDKYAGTQVLKEG